MFSGDSRPEEETKKMQALCEQIDEIIAIKRPATLILDDPAGNSHLQVSLGAGEWRQGIVTVRDSTKM